MRALVRYQIATYSGIVEVLYTVDDEDEDIISRAKQILHNKVGDFPFGYQSWKIVKRTDSE